MFLVTSLSDMIAFLARFVKSKLFFGRNLTVDGYYLVLVVVWECDLGIDVKRTPV